MKGGIPTTKIHLSTSLLIIIGLVDLASTIAWLRIGGVEGNPLFAPLLYHGIETFAFAKLVFLAGPIAVLEYARTKHPHSAEAGTWIAFVFYFALWGTQLIRLGQTIS